MSSYNYIQTFYVNPDAVNSASEVNATSVELFFRAKPSKVSNISGLTAPGVSIRICETKNLIPVPEMTMTGSIKLVEYDEINTSENATVGTIISFDRPVRLKAGQYYGIVISFLDPSFDLWTNKAGDRLVIPSGVTNNPSSGSQGRYDGMLYKTSSVQPQALTDRDLKFKVNIAKYLQNISSYSLTNKSYEFFKIQQMRNGSLQGGESVFQETANSPGTISFNTNSLKVTGIGTEFTSRIPDQFLSVNVSGINYLLKIKNIEDDTNLTVDRLPQVSVTNSPYSYPTVGTVYYSDYTRGILYLTDSTASNSTNKFEVGKPVIGIRTGASANVASIDNYKLDSFTPKFTINNPSTSNYDVQYKIANSSGGMSAFSDIELFRENSLNESKYVFSRSNEVVTASLAATNHKSVVVDVTLNIPVFGDNVFSAPVIEIGELDFFVYKNEINSLQTTYENDYDTEVDRNGLAISKAILKTVEFKERAAEDIRAYITAYRPAGTDIRLYAKIHNAADKEAFDDKSWTQLELKDNIDKFSNENPDDFHEYTFGLPTSPETESGLIGNFDITSGSAVIATSADQTSSLLPNDLIKIFDPLTPENNEVFVVVNITPTNITVNKPIININLIGRMYVDKLRYKNNAWSNINNDGISRYVNESGAEFDTFNSMQFKIVFYSDNSNIIPKVDQIQAIGVSA